MKQEIKVGDRTIVLSYEDLTNEIDVGREISIDYSNLTGEAVVTPLVSNAIGMLKADLEHEVSVKELEIKSFEADFVRDKRAEASKNGGKFTLEHKGDVVTIKDTEKALEKVYRGEKKWQQLQNELFIKQSYLKKIELIYWKIQDKNEKLKNLLHGVTPEDFMQDTVDATINRVGIKVKSENETETSALS